MARKLSDKFIDEEISKVHALYEKCRGTPTLPNQLDEDQYIWMRKQINDVIKHRADLSFVKGFWYGWTLKEGEKP